MRSTIVSPGWSVVQLEDNPVTVRLTAPGVSPELALYPVPPGTLSVPPVIEPVIKSDVLLPSAISA